jgi:tetratricopeptide (TPR) repeat protein
MKTKNTYNQKEYGVDALRCRTIDHRSSLAAACMMSLILCFSARPTIAGSGSAPADANSPAISEPNDANTPKIAAESAKKEPNQPPKPTIDNAAIVLSSPELAPQSARRDWLIASAPKTDLARKIWTERITSPESNEGSDRKKQLQQLIDRIRSIEFKPKEPPHEPIVVLEQTPPSEPNITTVEPADQNHLEVQPKHTASREPQTPTVSNETLNIIARQLKQPKLLKNPFELGEILFNAGRLNEAAICYRQALTRIDPNQPDSTQRRPWIIFQIGNCLRKDDPTKAIEAYSQLITQHGGSLWADPAKAQSSLIAWRQKNKPRLLIEQSQPNSVETGIPAELIKNNQPESLTEQKKGEQTQNK